VYLTDLVSLPLAHDRVHLKHDLVGVRHVGGDELHAGLDQPRYEVNIAGQSVELGDQQRCTRFFTQVEQNEAVGRAELPARRGRHCKSGSRRCTMCRELGLQRLP